MMITNVKGGNVEVKVYVDVRVNFDRDGRMIPQSLIWEDGTEYPIDKVTDICQAAAMKAYTATTSADGLWKGNKYERLSKKNYHKR